jgi:hypothetical protein
MDCLNISEAIKYSWIGYGKLISEISKECIESLRDEVIQIREKIKEVKNEVTEDYLLPYKLREKGVNSEDLVKLALFELARRLNASSSLNSSKERDGLRYIWIDMGIKKVLRGICNCKGFVKSELKNGFLVMIDGIVYAETYYGNEEEVLKEVISKLASYMLT